MSERERTHVSSGTWAHVPSPEDVRLQLEGRVEVVEAARVRYAGLESLLSGRGWKRRLRKQPEAIQAVLRHESELDEALSRIQRRAQADHWPESLPVLTAVREVLGLRGRLEVLVRKRLGGGLSRNSGAPGLPEGLAQLEAFVLQPVPLELASGEVRLLEGRLREVGLSRRIHVVTALAVITNGLVGGDPSPKALVVPLIAYLVYGWLHRGRYWLTSERLVWMPKDGEPVQIPLRSIRELGLRSFGYGVRVVGERETLTLAVDEPKQLQDLLLALEMHRKPPLLGSVGAERLANVVCYPATLESGSSRKGLVVLRPGYVAFLPMDRPEAVRRAIMGKEYSPPLNGPAFGLPFIIEHLRHLRSEAEFDACVERAVADAEGERWNPRDVLRYEAHVPSRKRLHLQTSDGPSKSLIGKVDRSQQEMAEHILANWPKP
ncbi:hypothetical protein F0U61_45595 [Archangium violaceum]|uniref:hypothetical protein n=1 Tax=Archangium violaceum TaxID=83451 RepID=UPI002B2EF575|nr:hypothetical protein F0U61_45595 [Archangium violaceum]